MIDWNEVPGFLLLIFLSGAVLAVVFGLVTYLCCLASQLAWETWNHWFTDDDEEAGE